MGLADAFDEKRADFSGIIGAKNLQFSAVIHKNFVEIDEEGCEVFHTFPGFKPEKPIVFRANRPFLFVILHRATKSILFIGRLVDPRSSHD